MMMAEELIVISAFYSGLVRVQGQEEIPLYRDGLFSPCEWTVDLTPSAKRHCSIKDKTARMCNHFFFPADQQNIKSLNILCCLVSHSCCFLNCLHTVFLCFSCLVLILALFKVTCLFLTVVFLDRYLFFLSTPALTNTVSFLCTVHRYGVNDTSVKLEVELELEAAPAAS